MIHILSRDGKNLLIFCDPVSRRKPIPKSSEHNFRHEVSTGRSFCMCLFAEEELTRKAFVLMDVWVPPNGIPQKDEGMGGMGQLVDPQI